MASAIHQLLDRRAHLPVGPGPADPGWGQKQKWGMEGATPTISRYDTLEAPSDTPFHTQIHNGIRRMFGRLPLDAPTMTREARVGAQVDSTPAARFFNQLGGASGTGRSWSGGATAATKRQVNINFNPNAQGAAELHPATTFDPFPAPGSLYPKVV